MTSHILLNDLTPIIDVLNRQREWIKDHLLLTRCEKADYLKDISRADEQIDLVLEKYGPRSRKDKGRIEDIAESAISQLHRVRKENKKLESQVRKLEEQDSFWREDDPFEPFETPEQLIEYPHEIVEIGSNHRFPNQFCFLDADRDAHCFSTKEEAEMALKAVIIEDVRREEAEEEEEERQRQSD